jgi:hypothetical protein
VLNNPQNDLKPSSRDRAVAIARGVLGLIPGIGHVLAETITWFVPNQRIDRIADEVANPRTGLDANPRGNDLLGRNPALIPGGTGGRLSVTEVLDTIHSDISELFRQRSLPTDSLPAEMNWSVYRSENFSVLTCQTRCLQLHIFLDTEKSEGNDHIVLGTAICDARSHPPRTKEELSALDLLHIEIYLPRTRTSVRGMELVWVVDQRAETKSTAELAKGAIRLFDLMHFTRCQ